MSQLRDMYDGIGSRGREATLVAPASSANSLHAERLLALARAFRECRILVVAAQAPSSEGPSWIPSLAQEPNIDILQLEINFGRGAALRAGLGAVETEFVVFLDIEGEVAESSVRCAIDVLRSVPQATAVFGNRMDKASILTISYARAFFTKTFALFARRIFALRCHDPQTPLKAFRTASVRDFSPELRLFSHAFDVELAFRSQQAGRKLLEIPITWNTNTPSRLIGQRAPSVIAALIWLRLIVSPLRHLPGLDLLGRRFAIPVKNKYHVLIFCWRDPHHPDAGGSEAYLFEQALAWARWGHSITWFAQSFPGCAADETLSGIKYVRRGKFPWVFLLAPLWYMFTSRREYDFIIDCMNGIPFCSPIFSTKPKICLVYHIHAHHFLSELPAPFGLVAAAVETKLAPIIYRNTKFMTISNSTRGELERRRMTRLPIGLIYSGVSAQLVPGEKSPQPSILYFGRLKKYKRVRNLILAFARLRERIPGLTLDIAGTGDDATSLKAYADLIGHEGICFHGRVDEARKLELMQRAWVFGMPSEIEGWGIVVIEAGACGTPSIAYNVPGLRDCIIPGETGMLANDDGEFESYLGRILTDPALRAELSSNALKWASNFSWDATARRTLEQIRLAQPWRAVFEGPVESAPQLRLGASLRVVASLLERT